MGDHHGQWAEPQWAAPQPPGWQPSFQQWKAFAPLASRATLATAGLAAAMLIQVVWIGQWLSFRGDVGRFATEDLLTIQQQIDHANRSIALTETLQLCVSVIAAAIFISWFHRAYKNIRTLGADGVSHAPGWAIGGWFIPLVNVVLPKQLANEIWRASDPDGPAQQGLAWKSRGIPSLYNWWWAVWLISNVSMGIGLELMKSAQDESSWMHGNDVAVAANAGTLIAALLAMRVVALTTRRQEARAQRLSSQAQPPQPAATVWPGS